jgi:hypothetical protein
MIQEAEGQTGVCTGRWLQVAGKDTSESLEILATGNRNRSWLGWHQVSGFE